MILIDCSFEVSHGKGKERSGWWLKRDVESREDSFFLICKIVRLLCADVYMLTKPSHGRGRTWLGEREPTAGAMSLRRWEWDPVHSGVVGTASSSTEREAQEWAQTEGDWGFGRSNSSILITSPEKEEASLPANSREGRVSVFRKRRESLQFEEQDNEWLCLKNC